MTPDAAFRANRLLAALPDAEYGALRPHLAAVRLDAGAAIYRAGERAHHAYFPLDGVAALVVTTADGGTVEVGSIGREGLVGGDALDDADSGPLDTVAQLPGAYARLPIAALRAAAASGTALHHRLRRFARALAVLSAATSACNNLHPVEERCARWLLLA